MGVRHPSAAPQQNNFILASHRKVPSHRHGQPAAAPGSKRPHTSVISRCLNLYLCTRHQYKHMYHIAGCRIHHEFILLLCQVSSMVEQPFCKRQVVGPTPPPGSTVPVHTGASWLPAKAMAEQRHTASKLFRLHLRAGNSPPCRVQSRLYGSLNTGIEDFFNGTTLLN